VIKNRQLFESIARPNLNDGVVRPPAILIVMDNDLGINTALHPTIWDDENERVIIFGTNSYDMQGSIAMGTNKIQNPGTATIVQYPEIQQMKIILAEVDLDALCDKLGTTLIPNNVRENIRKKLFTLADPEFYIRQSMNTHY
jgi:hypothetical protein